MGTPQSSYIGSTRNPTPRLLDRKKNLFSCDSDYNAKDPLYGIKPLDEKKLSYFGTFEKEVFVRSQENQTFTNAENHILDTPTRRSMRLQNKQLSENITKTKNATDIRDNLLINKYTGIPEEKHLHKLFSTYLNISGNQSLDSSSTSITLRNNKNSDSSENVFSKAESVAKKRELVNFNVHDDSLTETPKRKKMDNTCKSEPIHIPTKTFYSSKAKLNLSPNKKKSIIPLPNSLPLRNRRPERRMPVINMRKTVRHMIRRPARLSGGMNHSSYITEVQVDRILNNVRNDKLRELIESKRRERAQIQKLHEIIRNSEDPIKMARPLSALSGGSDTNNNYKGDKRTADVWDLDFSDVENSNSDISYTDRKPDNEKEIIYQPVGPLPSELIDEPPIERKFFKSGRSTATCKEIKITDTIKAVVHNGKISLQNKKKTRRQIPIRKSIDDFCNEQEIVSEILKNLDDTTTTDEHKQRENRIIEEPSIEISKNNHESGLQSKSTLPLLNLDVKDFRNRVPYNTNDPELIEQQHLLLDFLITNNICTEENFNIFIVDPENHKEDAARIVDEIIVLIDEYAEFRKRIPYRTSDPDIIAYQQQCLDFLISHNCCTEANFDKFIMSFDSRGNEVQNIVHEICNCTPQCLALRISDTNKIADHVTSNKDQQQLSTIDVEMQFGTLNSISTSNDEITKPNESSEKLFPIFYSNQYRPLIKKPSRRLNNWLRGYGFDQYQIDAGQKDFGAQQCKQCGLVYSIHEAEEEKLHRDYHASLHLLRFKAWIDEDAVAFYREWGADGRIVRITETSQNKKLERLKDVLKVVDKELGFSSYIIPKIFVAYLAIRRQQIVGICLVQPLERAHKFICINEIDCCTEETFEARCGISRIWVSPLHRRFGIGSKLIQAVQLNTIVGKEIPLHEIAFSAPTESGKVFAQKISGTSNFLVYQ